MYRAQHRRRRNHDGRRIVVGAVVAAALIFAGRTVPTIWAAPAGRSPNVQVPRPVYGCTTSRNPSGIGAQVALVNGVAEANLHNTHSSVGQIRQCLSASGLTTSVGLSRLSAIGAGPAGFPEVAYGDNLNDQPFCRTCGARPFPLPLSALNGSYRSYAVTADYSLGSPSPPSLPVDLIYDFWLRQHPSPGVPPRSGDIELLIFMYQRGMANCTPGRVPVTFTTNLEVSGSPRSTTWRVCQIYGGTAATPVAFFLESPAQSPSGQMSITLSDFVDEVGRYVGGPLGGYSLMGIELGAEFDQCSIGAGCQVDNPSWQWQITRLTFGDSSKEIPIVFADGPARRLSTALGP
jgi:hypothetical protein